MAGLLLSGKMILHWCPSSEDPGETKNMLAKSQPLIWDRVSPILYMRKLLEAWTLRNNSGLIKALLRVISLVFICIIKISTIELWALPPTKVANTIRPRKKDAFRKKVVHLMYQILHCEAAFFLLFSAARLAVY